MGKSASPKMNVPPEKLDLSSAIRLIFPGFDPDNGKLPARSWKACHKPRLDPEHDQRARLEPLDGIISNAMYARDSGDRKAIKLRTISELEALGIACPYFYARLGIAYAVGEAQAAEKDYVYAVEQRADLQEEICYAAKKIQGDIEKFQFRFTPGLLAALVTPTGMFGHPIKARSNQEAFLKIRDQYQYLTITGQFLELISEAAKSERARYVKTGQLNVWLLSFVTSIGRLWTDITGRTITVKSPAFQEFVSACYRAIGGKSNKEWFGRMKMSVNSRPDEGDWDSNSSVVPAEALLLCELSSRKDIDPLHAVAIRRALECNDDNAQATIKSLCETGILPVVITALLHRIQWSIEEIAEQVIGLLPEETTAMLGDIDFS